MNFTLSESQTIKFINWRNKILQKKDKHITAIGGAFTFKFTPTGIGTIVSVKGYGKKLDLTENL